MKSNLNEFLSKLNGIALFQYLEDFTRGKEDDPIGITVKKAIFEGRNISENLLDKLDRYDIVPMHDGFYLFIDRNSSEELVFNNENVFHRVKEYVKSRFNHVEIEWCKGVKDENEFKKRIKKVHKEKEKWLNYFDRIKHSEETRFNRIVKKYGRPFLYVGPEGVYYIGNKVESENKLSELSELFLKIKDTTPYLSEVIHGIEDMREKGIKDFNPSLLENCLFNYANSIDYEKVAEESNKSWGKYLIGSVLSGIGLIATAAGAYHYSNLSKKLKKQEIDSLKFTFDLIRRPSDSYENNDDARELAAAFDYIEFLDANSSAINSIQFESGDEQYLGEGWYDLERWGDVSTLWAGNNSIILMDVPKEAHFLRFRANSIGRNDYQDLEVEFRELMSNPNRMKIYLNDALVDEIPLYGRMQIHYANLRPELDSDGDGEINRLDINPRIPNPNPVKGDVDVGVYYLTGWGTFRGKSSDWSLGTPYHSFLGKYRSDDPDVTDWHIKWAVENGINPFIIPLTERGGWAANLEDGLLRAKFLPYIKFFVMFNGTPFWPGNSFGNNPNQLNRVLKESVTYFSQNYFNHPQYYKIKGKPALTAYQMFIYYGLQGRENFTSYVNLIRKTAKENGYNLYLIGDIMDIWHDVNKEEFMTKQFDAITSYIMLTAGTSGWEYDKGGRPYLVEPYDSMVSGYISEAKYWSDIAKKYKKGFIPPLTTGYDNSMMVEIGADLGGVCKRTDPSLEKYKQMCYGIRPYIDPELNIIIGGAWNEFQEAWVLEPTQEYDFIYLNLLSDFF